MEDTSLVNEALIEANDLLQEEVTRLRGSHKVLRTVIRQLRGTLATYRELLKTASYNDEMFKALCNGEFDPPVALTEKGGLPEPEGVVKSAIASVEEASATTASS